MTVLGCVDRQKSHGNLTSGERIIDIIKLNSDKSTLTKIDVRNNENFEIEENLKEVDSKVFKFISEKLSPFQGMKDYKLKLYYYVDFPLDNDYFMLVSTMKYDGKKTAIELFEIKDNEILYIDKLSDTWSAAECTGYSYSLISNDNLVTIKHSDCYVPEGESYPDEKYDTVKYNYKDGDIVKEVKTSR